MHIEAGGGDAGRAPGFADALYAVFGLQQDDQTAASCPAPYPRAEAYGTGGANTAEPAAMSRISARGQPAGGQPRPRSTGFATAVCTACQPECPSPPASRQSANLS